MGDFRKIMNDQEMYTLIKEKLGLADFAAFKEYLERAANPQGTNSGSVGESWMGSVANWLLLCLTLKLLFRTWVTLCFMGML